MRTASARRLESAPRKAGAYKSNNNYSYLYFHSLILNSGNMYS